MILVFANSIGDPDYFTARCKINSIFHPELGRVAKINPDGIDCTIVLKAETKLF
jgi:hypothetical protein